MSVTHEDLNGTVQSMKTRAEAPKVNFLGDNFGIVGGSGSVYTGDESCSEIFKDWTAVKDHVTTFVNNELLYQNSLTREKKEEILKSVLSSVEAPKDLIMKDKDISKLNRFIKKKFDDVMNLSN